MPVTAGDVTTVVEHPALDANGMLQAAWACAWPPPR